MKTIFASILLLAISSSAHAWSFGSGFAVAEGNESCQPGAKCQPRKQTAVWQCQDTGKRVRYVEEARKGAFRACPF